MNKKKLVMATLLAITLTLSIVSTTVVYAQEETQSTNTESLADESEQSTYETVAAESESIEPDIPEYAPSLTLASSTWTGQSEYYNKRYCNTHSAQEKEGVRKPIEHTIRQLILRN